MREAEMRAAAELLGLHEVVLLDYQDGQLTQANQSELVCYLVHYLRRIRPDVVLTFDPFGVYGHPDHIAISQAATTAVIQAANATYEDEHEQPPHQVQKLYYRVVTPAELGAYTYALGDLTMTIDGQPRRATGWAPWAVTTQIDTADYWEQVWTAVSCHKSQLLGYQALHNLPEEHHQAL